MVGLVGLIGLLAVAPSAQAPTIAITDVTLIDGGDGPVRPGMTVVVRGGTIAEIAPSAAARVPSGAMRVDGRGRYLIPGLIDAHVHLATRPDVTPELVLPALVAHGVLAVRDMGGDLDRVLAMRRKVEASELAGPAIVTPGPFLDGAQQATPIVTPVTTAAEAEAAVRALAARKVDFLMVQAGLTAEAWRVILGASRAVGLTVAGHVPEAMSAFDVVNGGQRSVEHVSPALPGDAALMLAVSREETAIRAALREPSTDVRRRLIESIDPARQKALFTAMREHDVTAVPTMVWSAGLLPQTRNDIPAADVLAFIPRAARTRFVERRKAALEKATDEGLALNRAIAGASRQFVGAMHRAGVTIAAGTDALDSYLPLGPSLHAELEQLVAAGMTPRQALTAATREAARLAGFARSRGTIVVGKSGDVVLLDADPAADITAVRRINAVIHRGRVLDRAALDTMLERVRDVAGR